MVYKDSIWNMAPLPTIFGIAGIRSIRYHGRKSPGHVSVEIGNQLIFFMAQSAAIVGDARP